MTRNVFYILVNSATEGMALYTGLKERGCKARIAPSPRQETTCCGVSIMVESEDIDAVRAALSTDEKLTYDRIVELELDIDPNRDRYC